MVTISLPDGAKREFPDGATGTTVAEAISRSLARKAVGQAARFGELYLDLVKEAAKPFEALVATSKK